MHVVNGRNFLDESTPEMLDQETFEYLVFFDRYIEGFLFTVVFKGEPFRAAGQLSLLEDLRVADRVGNGKDHLAEL